MNFGSYSIGQNTQISINNPQPLLAIGGDNQTPFFLNFPQLPQGLRWVQPFTSGFMYPIPDKTVALNVRSDMAAPGFAVPVSGSTSLAYLTAYDTPQQFTAGITLPRTAQSIPTQFLTIEQSLAGNGAAVLVNSVAGQQIYLFDFEGALDAGVAAGWFKFRNATDGTDFGPEFASATGQTPHIYPFRGLSLAVGKALGILNSPAGALVLRGGLTYNQQ